MSDIDPTQPPAGQATTAAVRENFAQAKAELEILGADDAALAALAAHPAAVDNPHAVTWGQTGADQAGSAATVLAALDNHADDLANPHAVTAAQVGADPAGTENTNYIGIGVFT